MGRQTFPLPGRTSVSAGGRNLEGTVRTAVDPKFPHGAPGGGTAQNEAVFSRSRSIDKVADDLPFVIPVRNGLAAGPRLVAADHDGTALLRRKILGLDVNITADGTAVPRAGETRPGLKLFSSRESLRERSYFFSGRGRITAPGVRRGRPSAMQSRTARSREFVLG